MTESVAAELLALVVGAALVALAPALVRRLDRAVTRTMSALARAPRAMPWMLGVVVGAAAAAAAYHVHWPEPSVHDEYAYLLGAETFAGGELTRPTHPLWPHFETFHILHEPSYAPKYPTGQSLMLALGMVLFDEPRAGLWMEAAMMVAAITWMLFQWVPGRWALIGGVLIALQLGVRGPWVQTFFGGALAATGGALLLGAVPGILRRHSSISALLMGTGLVLLALSRPFEGLMASLPVALVLLRAWMVRPEGKLDPGGRASFGLRVALPLALVLAVGGGWLAVHNRAVTGDATTLPYAAYDEQYSVYPPFLFQDLSPKPEYRDPGIEWFMLNFQRGSYGTVGDPVAAVGLGVARAAQLAHGILGLPLAVLLLVCAAGHLLLRGFGRARLRKGVETSRSPESPGLDERKRMTSAAHSGPRWLPLAVVLSVALASSITTYAAPHYAAPALGALTLLLVSGLRRARGLARRARGHSVPIVLAVAAALVITTVERGSKSWLGGSRRGGEVRSMILDRVSKVPGRDLILVRALSMDSVHQDMVFNAADIDAAPVVWARDLRSPGRPDANADLLRYYGDRTVWLLTLEHVLEDRWELTHIRDPRPESAASSDEPGAPPWAPW